MEEERYQPEVYWEDGLEGHRLNLQQHPEHNQRVDTAEKVEQWEHKLEQQVRWTDW